MTNWQAGFFFQLNKNLVPDIKVMSNFVSISCTFSQKRFESAVFLQVRFRCVYVDILEYVGILVISSYLHGSWWQIITLRNKKIYTDKRLRPLYRRVKGGINLPTPIKEINHELSYDEHWYCNFQQGFYDA